MGIIRDCKPLKLSFRHKIQGTVPEKKVLGFESNNAHAKSRNGVWKEVF